MSQASSASDTPQRNRKNIPAVLRAISVILFEPESAFENFSHIEYATTFR